MWRGFVYAGSEHLFARFFLITLKNKLNKMKPINLLQLLFAAFTVLKLAGVQPFNNWSWWLIALLILADIIIAFIIRAVQESQIMKIIWAEIALTRYNILLKKETNKFKNQLKNAKN